MHIVKLMFVLSKLFLCLSGSASMYEAGMQYHYQYQGEVSSTATAGQEESRLALTAEVFIIADSPCDLKLQVCVLTIL